MLSYALQVREEYYSFLKGRKLSQIEDDLELLRALELGERFVKAADECRQFCALLEGTGVSASA